VESIDGNLAHVILSAMKPLLVTVAAIVLGFFSSLSNNTGLTCISTLIALIGAYAQYKDSLPFTFSFNCSSWEGEGTDLRLTIHRKKHNKTSPVATVYRLSGRVYEEVTCEIQADLVGAIVLASNTAFSGKVVIR